MNSDAIADLKQFISATVFQSTSDIRSDISGIKDDVTSLKEDVSGLKKDVTILKQDVSGLKQDVAILKQDVYELKQDVKRLDGKIDDLSESVADAISVSNETTHSTLVNHEKRITKLERKTV